jgi:ribosomal protein S18 acetylase RimI-like enzyme
MLRSQGGKARVRPWWRDAAVAQLTFLDHGLVPNGPAVAVWLGELRARGFHGVRTGAVTEAGEDVLRRHGFRTIQRLALLEMSLVDWRPPRPEVRTRRMRQGERTAVAALDRAAFGDEWGIDVTAIVETCAATPGHHARVVERDRVGDAPARDGLAGFAISGRAERTGYLQRLAVAPDMQRHGIGMVLTLEALRWMRRQRLTRAVVNTHVENHAALALYAKAGFRQVPRTLAVMARQLDDL